MINIEKKEIICDNCGVNRYLEGLLFGFCPECRKKHPLTQEEKTGQILSVLEKMVGKR